MNLRVAPAHDVAPDFLIVLFTLQADPPPLTQAVAGSEAPEPVAQHLERELERIKAHLRDIVEQYEASAEELKASNEELQAMNEELRSATEELETGREELQSVNEELTTVNQELKSKVDELGHANSDLQNLMGANAIATVFLDRDLHITRYTPSAVRLFNLIPSDIGRPLADLKERLDYPALREDARGVLAHLTPVEREIRGRDDWFIARLLPYRTADDHIAGVVLTFIDITERKRSTAALHEADERMRRALALAGIVVWEYDLATRSFSASENFADLYGIAVPAQLDDLHRAVHVKDAQPHRQLLASLAARGGESLGEFRIVRPDLPDVLWVEELARARIDADGRVTSIMGVGRDVTARHLLEAKTELAHGELLDNIAARASELAAMRLAQQGDRAEQRHSDTLRDELLRRLVTAQEDERRRIARDLHDSVGQHLAALNLELKNIALVDGCPPAVESRIARMSDVAMRLDEEIDRLSYELRPPALDDLGLAEALYRHMRLWTEESGVIVDAHLDELGKRWPAALETTIYRVIQEALTNVRKHAGATRVSLLAERSKDQLRVIIEDNGRGFEPEKGR